MNYKTQAEKSDYLYILRRTLPPWRWRENLDELLEYAVKYRIDEVCVKIDTGTFTHNFPSEDWLQNYQKILFTIRDELTQKGIRYSLNPNVLQGHEDRGRNIAAQHPDWQMITGPDGNHCTDCVCMSSPGWREYFKHQWTLYAQTKPSVIWLEDDLRTYWHSPVVYGCFCDEHLRRFNEKCGTNFSREELYSRIVQDGSPDKVRNLWLDLQSEMVEEVLALSEDTVHSISPDTVIGLMSSGPEMHALEGRNWERFHSILSGEKQIPVASRPPMGGYREGALADCLYYAADIPRLTRTAFRKSTIEEGEIENYPYTGFSKSNRFTFLQTSLAIGVGCEAVTLNLYDHCGTPMSLGEDILQSLNFHKDFLSGLKKRTGCKGKCSGIRCYFNPESSRFKKLPENASLFDLKGEATAWSTHLQSMGFAATFDESPTIALSGQDIWAASDTEIESILSQAVLCDSTAFLALYERGYGKMLGGTPKRQFHLGTTYPLAGEHFYNTKYGGGRRHCFPMAIHKGLPLFVEIEQSQGAVELSEIVDPDFKRIFPGTYLFNNELGGRIAVFPFEIAKLGRGFSDPVRKTMLDQILKQLTQNRIPLYLSGDRNLLALRNDYESYSICGFYNFSLDILNDLYAKFYLGNKQAARIEMLSATGEWRNFNSYSCTGMNLQIRIERLSFENPLYLTIWYQG